MHSVLFCVSLRLLIRQKVVEMSAKLSKVGSTASHTTTQRGGGGSGATQADAEEILRPLIDFLDQR
jgi:hypothetical protein